MAEETDRPAPPTGQGAAAEPPDNEAIAAQLERIADLLEAQNENPFRVGAYRQAAGTLRGLDEPAHQLLVREGIEGLQRLPHIGDRLSRSIEQYIEGGGIGLLEHLQGPANSQLVLSSVSGIGPELARRIYEQLGIETLADLEAAAYDGRLAQVEGFGPKRIRGVRESLATRLRRGSTGGRPGAPQPPVELLLDLDRDYRAGVEADRLPRIAPRRFNPSGEAWLPILHTERGGQRFSVLFSNTPRAHELGTTRDWVVIYRDDRDGGGQWTVVTARQGKRQGKRVVRGRERE